MERSPAFALRYRNPFPGRGAHSAPRTRRRLDCSWRSAPQIETARDIGDASVDIRELLIESRERCLKQFLAQLLGSGH